MEGESKRGMNQLTGRTRTNRIVNFEASDKSIISELVDVKIQNASPNSLKGEL